MSDTCHRENIIRPDTSCQIRCDYPSPLPYLGINTDGLKRCIVALVALTVGAGVAATGPIGFVGLVVPHLLRLWIGPDHRYLLPGVILLGAILLIVADLIARTVLAPTELPIGIVTAAMGAPFFLFLLLRQRRQWSL